MDKILVLAPHSDDAELGVGGTISRFLREGDEVYCVVFSKALSFTKGGYIPKEDEIKSKFVFQELKESMKELGVKEENLFIYQFPTRYLYSNRQDVLDKIIEARNTINPDIVFLPSTDDFHQDHQVVCKEGIRAFKNKTLLGYEFPWNTLSTNLNCFCSFEEEDLKKKIKALEKYSSQKDRPFMSKNFIRNWAELNGIKVGVRYAESFEVIRLVK